MNVKLSRGVIIDVKHFSSCRIYITRLVNFKILRIFFGEGAIIRVKLVDGVNEDAFFPLCSTLGCELVVVQEVGGHECLGLYPAMVARDDPL